MGFLFLIIIMALSWGVSARLKSKINKYSQEPLSSGLSGREVAEKMLRDNGINDVSVISTPGSLTDHYNPANKTVNLSPEVYEGRSIASAAVAAHECGHAVQHQKAYMWLGVRSALVPVVQFTSPFISILIFGGILMLNVFPQLLLAGIILFAATTLFSFITLPVEMDASRRGLAWIETTHLTSNDELDHAKDALWWAGMTYVVAALSSLATLLYYISFFNGKRN